MQFRKCFHFSEAWRTFSCNVLNATAQKPGYAMDAAKKAPAEAGARRMPDYLTTLALPPDMSFSTSFTFAMEVSPGVVMAKAPWAAP